MQSVVPMQLPFASVKDLDCQHQLRHDQTLAKRHPSPLKAEQRKQAKMPPQPDPHNAFNGGRTQTTEWGHSRVRGEDRQKELDRVRAAVRARSTIRVGSTARVIGGAKGRRAVGTMRPRHTTGTRYGNPESGRPNVGGRNPASPLATP